MNKLATLCAGLMFVALVGCNTVAGAGKDVSKVGEKTTEAAKKTSEEIKKK